MPLSLNLGYSHPINFPLPDGISASVEKNVIKLSGIDKDLLGYTASTIRNFRPPNLTRERALNTQKNMSSAKPVRPQNKQMMLSDKH
ncbi:MAG: 50S ribosomal protein L6 [Desulfobacterales bacterium]